MHLMVVQAILLFLSWLCHVTLGLHCIGHDECGENAACITINATSKAGRCMCFVGFQGNGVTCVDNPNALNPIGRNVALRRLANGKIAKCEVEPPRTVREEAVRTDRHSTSSTSINHDLSKTSLEVSEAPLLTNLRQEFGDAKCTKIVCNFEFGPCAYRNIAGSRWGVMRGEYGREFFSRITRAAKGEGYAVIRGTDDGQSMHVLVSEETRFPISSALAFNYHWTNPLTRLRVCLDGLDNCLWQADEQSQGGGNWSLGLVALPPGQHRVIFVADRLSGLDQIGLDNVRLMDSNAQPADCF